MCDQNFIENNLVILSKQTLDLFLKQKNPSELISLYTFLYYTAKWQKTNQPRCTVEYIAKGLHWGTCKVRRVKKQLRELGLIEDIFKKDEHGKITKWYVKLNYIWKQETLTNPHPSNFTNSGAQEANHPHNFPQCGAQPTNALNALSTNVNIGINASRAGSSSKPPIAPHEETVESKKQHSQQPEVLSPFERFWKAYPKKRNKGQAEKAFRKLNPDKELLDHMLDKLETFKQSKDWRRLKGKYIPYPATWLNAKGWEDEIETEVEPMDPLEELEPRTVSEAKWLDGQRQARFLLEEDQNKIRGLYGNN